MEVNISAKKKSAKDIACVWKVNCMRRKTLLQRSSIKTYIGLLAEHWSTETLVSLKHSTYAKEEGFA